MARNELLALRIALRLLSDAKPYESGDPLFGCSVCCKPVLLSASDTTSQGHLPACMHPICNVCYVDKLTLCTVCSLPVGDKCRPASNDILMRELTQLVHALGSVAATQTLVDGAGYSPPQSADTAGGKRACPDDSNQEDSKAPSAASLFGASSMCSAQPKPLVQQTLYGTPVAVPAASTFTKGKTSRPFASQYPSGKNKCFVCGQGWAKGEMICFVTGTSEKTHARCA